MLFSDIIEVILLYEYDCTISFDLITHIMTTIYS